MLEIAQPTNTDSEFYAKDAYLISLVNQTAKKT